MFIRYFLEALIFFLLALVFQYFLAAFNTDVHLVIKDLEKIEEDPSKEEEIMPHLKYELSKSGLELMEAMDVAMVSFSFPIRTIMILIFSRRTGRNYKIANFSTFIDMSLFFGVLVWFI